MRSKNTYVRNIINRTIVNFLLSSWIGLSKYISNDIVFLKVYYLLKMKEKLNINAPQTYTQKLQYLKLHNTNELYAKMVDKFSVKSIVSDIIGEKYIIPLLGVWDKFEDIDFMKLPDQFVLKTTHDSGNVVICRDKSKLNLDILNNKFSRALRTNYFYKSREYPYKKAIPRIIAEKFMVDDNQNELVDYKLFCFHGEPKFIQVTNSVNGKRKVSYFDLDYNLLPFTTDNHDSYPFEKPLKLNEMLEIARILSKDIIHVRIDLYLINNEVYFGEFTFHNNGGIVHFNPKDWNKKIGDWIHLN